jgi:hypothetical protein
MARPSTLSGNAARAFVLAAALITGTGLLTGTGMESAAAAAGPVQAQHAQAKTEEFSSERTEPLLNGDRVSIVRGPSGQPTVAVLGTTPGLEGALLHFSVGGDSYEVPVDALPYIGRGLDPSLFDVADLAALYTAGELPVSISYQGSQPALPGVTVTKAGAGLATGYLTAGSARVFGAALMRQFLADHARGSYGNDGIFAGGLTISLAGTAGDRVQSAARPDAPDKPAYVMRTLTVDGTNLAGKPDTGDEVLVINADNADRFGAGEFFTGSASVFYHGVAKFSVPVGHYWAVGFFADGNALYQPILPQFTVSRNTTVSIRERAANSELTITTPRPSVLGQAVLQVVRAGAAGPAFSVVSTTFPGFPVFVSPTVKRPTVGTLATYTSGQLLSPASAPAPYFYNIADQDRSGLVHSQRITVTQASLATVTARYYADVPSTGVTLPDGYYPGQVNTGEAFGYGLSVPEQRTEYYTAGSPPVTWFDTFFQTTANYDAGQYDNGQTFRPGEVTTDDWNAYPLHTTLDPNGAGAVAKGPGGPVLVSANRAGDTLTLYLSPFGDNDPGHNSFGYSSVFDGGQTKTSGSYEIEENGKKIASGNPLKSLGEFGGFFTRVKLASGTGTVTAILDSSQTGEWYTLSTQTQTAWTWRSAPAARGTVPAGWACDWSRDSGPTGRDCTPQPLLTLDYTVAGLNLTGTAPPGSQAVTVHVAPMALTAASKITSLTAQVSFDDGKTWQPATVTGSGDIYRAAFTAPASALVSLRVSAADAAGSQIAETITRGYATGAAPAAPAALTAGPLTRGAAAPATPPSGSAAGLGGALRAACPPAPAGQMRCYALYAPQRAVNRAMAAGAAVTPAGWGARSIESAYRLPVARNPRQTVAVVDAYFTPALASDLNIYRKQYGLPACTTSSGCLRIVNEKGAAKPLPSLSGVPIGWALETALDAEMVSAACPKCRILVVEANSQDFADMATAENTAARLGATVISNSYGSREDGFALAYASAYRHPGHTIVVSSGDYGFGAANFPAVLGTVTAVGGTELAKARNARGWTERVWSDGVAGGFASASGCSAYIAKPAWQHDPHCAMRTTTDVSAVGSNVAIYTSNYGGWQTVEGTSISAPLIAGVYALAGNAAKISPGYEYAHAKWLYDVTSGNNDLATGTGAECGDDYLCVAKRGYDAPTGLGTPDGTGAF